MKYLVHGLMTAAFTLLLLFVATKLRGVPLERNWKGYALAGFAGATGSILAGLIYGS